MSPKDLVIEAPGEINLISAYVCDLVGCGRCYNEGAGYFDFVAGKPSLGNRQKLCRGDAHPMFLETVSAYNEIWRCLDLHGR
jgi:hypothetical protein